MYDYGMLYVEEAQIYFFFIVRYLFSMWVKIIFILYDIIISCVIIVPYLW